MSKIKNLGRITKKRNLKYIGISLIIAVVLLASNIMIATENKQQNGPNLEIEEITGGFGIETVITNTGDETANGVRWNTTVNGSLVIRGDRIIPPVPVVSSLEPGESISVSSWQYDYIFGFGNVELTVITTCDEGVEDIKSAQAIIVGPLLGVY